MPRLHSVSQYHSQPSIKQSPGSNMSSLPLLHLNPRNSPLKTRLAIPVHFENRAGQPTKPRRCAPEQSNRSKSKPDPRSTSANSTGPKRYGDTQPLSIDSPDRLVSPSPTPRPRTLDPAPKGQVLSLSDFCDQLTAEVHDQSSQVNPSACLRMSKKKSAHRRSKKGGQRRAPMCPALSDSEDVLTFDHSIFLSHECPSRSATPSPVIIAESLPMLSGPTLVLHDVKLTASPAAAKPSSMSVLPSTRASDTAASSLTRQHVRSKSVASIFDLEKPHSASKPLGAKDDWDMPPAAPPRGLTWQQEEKKSTQSASPASTSSQVALKPAYNDSSSSLTANASSHVNEPSSRRQRTAQAGTPPQIKSSKKKHAAACVPRKAGVPSSVKPCTGGPPPSSSKRRNSLSSPRPSTVQTVQLFENSPIHEKSRSLGSKNGENVIPKWKSFPTPASGKSAQPIVSNPLPILGTHADFNTPNRRHIKSHTHQPTVLPHNSSTPVSSHIPDSVNMKVMTPSKPRSTSEDLYLGTPANKLSSPALRADFMYAGPQFHNSPCPAALPAPKFSFVSS